MNAHMQEIAIFQVDAFTGTAFGGNPAAVCPVANFMDDSVMQSIARENNLSETAFIVARTDRSEVDFDLRWFTPTTEVDLCGHATLGAAHVVMTQLETDLSLVRFMTRSGLMTVRRDGERLSMDFPSLMPEAVNLPDGLAEAMGARPDAIFHRDRDYMLVYPDQATIEGLNPDLVSLKSFAPFGFVATAPAAVVEGAGAAQPDFVSRCFFPNHGISEDPVTGSAHCLMGPYWSERLGKKQLYAQQLSARGGKLWLTIRGERMDIAGQVVDVMRGAILM